MSIQKPDNGPVENQEDDSAIDAFQLMAQGLAQMQVANNRLHIALRQQEQRMIEALQQHEQRSQEAVQEVLQLQEQGLQEKINEVKQVMEGKIARVSEAVCNLTLAVNEGLKRVGERLDILESASVERKRSEDARGNDAFEQLESRMKNLEVSVRRALKSVFPRVNALVTQLEHHELAVTPQNSLLGEISTSTALSSGVTASQPSSSATSPSAVAQLDVEQERCIALGRDLCKAAEEGEVEDVRKLLGAGAVANFSDSDGWTALHWAARNAHTEIVALLLDQGADVNARDTDGDTPLHLAALYDRVGQCIFLLIDAGAHTDSKDKNGETPLGWAANAGNIAAVKLLKAGRAKEMCEVSEDQVDM